MNPPAQTTAVILAGGQGTRLRRTLPDIPKVLADISGKPFIRVLLDRLEQSGIRRVVLCTGFKGRMIREALGDGHGSMRLLYSQEESPLGTAGALGNARHLLPDGPALVMNGDSYCHTDLERFYVWHLENKTPAALLLTRVADTGRYGRVEIDSAGYIISFCEKTTIKGPGMINAGIYLIDKALIDTFPAHTPCSLEQDIFPALAGQGRLTGFPTKGAFLDIGTAEAYHSAPGFLAGLEGQS